MSALATSQNVAQGSRISWLLINPPFRMLVFFSKINGTSLFRHSRYLQIPRSLEETIQRSTLWPLGLAHQIRTLRVSNGRSKERLALACELDRTYVSVIERSVSLANSEKRAQTLEVDPWIAIGSCLRVNEPTLLDSASRQFGPSNHPLDHESRPHCRFAASTVLRHPVDPVRSQKPL